MNFLTALIDGIAAFIRRNPITVLVILLLALLAPAVLKGIALFVLYTVIGLVVVVFLLLLLFRVRIYRLRKQMEEQFGDPNTAGAWSDRRTRESSVRHEGEVRIRRTADAPRKRVSKDVGDYVEFEETTEPDGTDN